MKPQRRIRVARLQGMQAQMARREAMSSLADAIKEESRSSQLARRSQDLLAAYRQRMDANVGAGLQHHARFVRSLKRMADQSEKASSDARDQAYWQMQALAAAETRLDRSEDRMKAARKEAEALIEKREHHAVHGLARKLHSKSER